MNKVSIVVLNYNGLKHLKECIPSLQKQTYKNIEVIVVDNNSTDGSIEYLKKINNIKVLLNKENYGYAMGNNIGAENANGEYIFILNNDTKVFTNAVEILVKNYEKKSILIPKQIISKDGNVIEVVGNGADIFGYPYGYNKIVPKNKLFYADGAAIFLKRLDFIEIGTFDSTLFMFQEDIDFSWRAHLYGYKLKQVPEAKLYHYSGGTAEGGTSSKEFKLTYFRRYYNERNIIINILKNYSLLGMFCILPILFLVHLLELVVLALKKEKRAIKCYFDAYKWVLSNLNVVFAKRKIVQNKRTKSDLYVLMKMTYAYSKLTAFSRQGSIPEFK